MRRLHLFNPENDLALGLGCRNYTPPPNAAALHRAGVLLPVWWAESEDAILAPGADEAEIAWLKARYGLMVNLPDDVAGYRPTPWGWSADAVRQFARTGVDPHSLPDDEAIAKIRALSHRRSSRLILESFDCEDIITIETADADKVVEMERLYPGCYVKSPWSGSGRGVFCAAGLSEKTLRDKAVGIIHRQGSVMVERGLDKVTDCAALFRMEGGRARFEGLSIFITEPRGMYGGNIVAPQSLLCQKLADKIGGQRLQTVVNSLAGALTGLIGMGYEGWLGVDMMVWRAADGSLRLHPCVELNLRYTMGVVALEVQRSLGNEMPMLMSWRRDVPEEATSLLPPREGFCLALTNIPNF